MSTTSRRRSPAAAKAPASPAASPAVAIVPAAPAAPSRPVKSNLRGNSVLFAAAFAVGVPVEVARYINPNRDGKGSVLPYVTERKYLDLGDAEIVEIDGVKCYRFKEESVRNGYRDIVTARGYTPEDVVKRATEDYKNYELTGVAKYSKIRVKK
jgi:hypothetical protein